MDENEDKVRSHRNLYRVRITLMQKELEKLFRTYLPYQYDKYTHISPEREELLQAMGMTVTRNSNNIMKIGFQSKYDYLLFKLKWS